MIYQETQYFRQWWVVCLLGGLFCLFSGMAVQQLLLHHPVGDKPVPDWGMWLLLIVFGVGMPCLLLTAHLRTVVDQKVVRLRFFPFHFHDQVIEGIVNVEPCVYRPIADYGGWGIREGAMGKAYTVAGKLGVRLTLASGESLLVGSREPERFAEAIRSVIPACR
jgi:hypothetical protein